MFNNESGSSNIDTVECREGSFKIPDGSAEPQIELTMVYSNKESGLRFGTCPAKTSVMSKETLDAFFAFMELAEKDFGTAVFEAGELVQRSPYLGAAESEQPLPKGLGRG